jgi:amino acid transporter
MHIQLVFLNWTTSDSSSSLASSLASWRTLWSVSRYGAFPFSKYWMKVSPKLHLPGNTIRLSATVIFVSHLSILYGIQRTLIQLYGLIFLG